MERNLFDTLTEPIDDIEDRIGKHDVVLLPPANDLYASDEEVGNDDTGFGGNLDLRANLLVLLKFMELNQVTVRLMMKLMNIPKRKGKITGLSSNHFVS